MVIGDWDVVGAVLITGEEPASNEAAAIMAIDRTKPARPYLILRAFVDKFSGGCSWSGVNPTFLNDRH